MRQQQTHQQSSSASNSKSSSRSSCSSSSLSSSRGNGSSNAITNNNNKSNNSSGITTGSSSKNSNASSALKQAQGSNTSSSNNNQLTHQNSNTNNNTTTANANNGLASIGHNSSPILPMTPTSSVSPPVNVICKKELSNNYGVNSSVPGLSDVMKSTSIHDSIKEEMAGMIASNPIAYSNINGRLGHGGNSTPLGSNSSIITTPSPPMTPSQNALSYVPNHESYFWHSQYNQYPNSYNTPASYYSQVDYQAQSNYSMGHSGYSTSNMGLTASNTFNGSMTSQPFASNGFDYMSPAPEKYI